MSAYTVGLPFAGQDGIGLAFRQAGFTPRWHVEINPFRRDVIALRNPRSDIFEDINDVGRHNLKSVTVMAGGWPCTPVSGAGKRRGTADPRWLWHQFARVIGELRPRIVFLENADEICAPIRDGGRIVAAAPAVGVVADLTALGYDCSWGVVPASAVGAPHERKRWWCVAHTDSYSCTAGGQQYEQRGPSVASDADGEIPDADQFRWGRQLPPAVPIQSGIHQSGDAALSGGERSAELHASSGVALGDTSRYRLQADDWRRQGGTSPEITRVAYANSLRYAERTGLQGADGPQLAASTFTSERSGGEQILPARKSDVGRKCFDGLSGQLERLAREQYWAAPLGERPHPYEPARFTDDTYHWKDRIEAIGDSVCVPLVRAFAESIRAALEAE